MRLITMALLTAMFLPAGPACAAPSAEQAPLDELRSQSVPEQRQAVVAAFQPGERFAELDKSGRDEVLQAFDRMQEVIGEAGSVGALDPDQKVAVFNDQELINEILTEAERDSRISCKRNRSVNSRIKTSECHTFAEWERRRERARKLAEMNKRSVNCVENMSDGGSWCG